MSAVPLPLLSWLAILLSGWAHDTHRTVVRAARASANVRTAPVMRSRPRFVFEASALTHAQRTRIAATSWHPGCPVGLSQLRHLRIGYWGFGYRPHLGEMVVNASAVDPLRRAFAALFAARFPIRRMRLVDDYGGSDYASIAADNTSAFNCRNVTGGSGWSMHAYGLAIDINPIENPYVHANGTTAHAASRPYLDRRNVREGMAVPHGALVRAFDAIGWGWGGRWPPPTDYQHFSADGR
jgi:D-alanyl-D-alanine carboxypeptidase-like protein